MASADINALLNTQPPALPANVARVKADGTPTTHLLDWELFQIDWFARNVVATDKRIDQVKATADGASAAVTTEIQARIDADGALAQQITTISATWNQNLSAAITSEATARANADGALAQQITTVSATWNQNLTAAVTSEATARANADGALSLRIDSVQATAGNATANGQIYFAAMAGPTGSAAAYGIFLTAGSAYTGMMLVAKSDGTAAIMFDANYFALNDSGTLKNVFNYMGGVFTFNVPVRIRNGDILDEAVSRSWFDTGNTSANVTVPNVRGTGYLKITAQYKGSSAAYSSVDQFELRIFEDGNLLDAIPVTQAQNGTGTAAISRYGATPYMTVRRPGGGSHTYQVQLVRTVSVTGVNLSGVIIIVEEFSK